jgi:hypothetical protein
MTKCSFINISTLKLFFLKYSCKNILNLYFIYANKNEIAYS